MKSIHVGQQGGSGLTEHDVFEATVDELLATFRQALLGLLPSATRSLMRWDGIGAHPDWERLSMVAYDVFVRNPIMVDRSRGVSDAPLPRYDIDVDSYSDLSWISIANQTGNDLAFVRFLTVSEPFDSMQGAVIDPRTGSILESHTVAWPAIGTTLMRRPVDARQLQRLSSIVAEE